MDKEFLTLKEFAKEIHYSERRVRQMCIDGKIEARKINDDARKWLIPVTELERLKAGSKLTTKGKQKPYEDTPHKQKMRRLARELATIRLPSVIDSFRVCGRVCGEHLAGYSELCNDDVFFVIEFENREIAAYADLEGLESTDDFETAEANYEWKTLFSHLDTGGFSGVIDRIKYFKPKLDVYLECCRQLLKLVEKRIENDILLSGPFSYSEKFGFRPFFTILIGVDAVQTYAEPSSVECPSYRIEPMEDRWALTCDGLEIFVGHSRETLSSYEKLHKELRLQWIDAAKTEKTKAITEIRKDLENTVNDIRKSLLTFAGKQTLPGHCELDS